MKTDNKYKYLRWLKITTLLIVWVIFEMFFIEVALKILIDAIITELEKIVLTIKTKMKDIFKITILLMIDL